MGSPRRTTWRSTSKSLQLSLLVLFAGCRKFLEGEYKTDIKALVKDEGNIIESDMEKALDIAADMRQT
jgi:hypothetical protein